jgi:ribosomal protein L40E
MSEWHKRRNFKSKGTNIPGLLIDDCDRHLIENKAWCVNWLGYVGTTYHTAGGKAKYVALHRVIMNAPPRVPVDHINGNKLDNRRCNLRFASHAKNCQNTAHRRPKGRSGVKNVLWNGATQKWVLRVGRFGKLYQQGYYDTVEDAAAALPAFVAQLDKRLASQAPAFMKPHGPKKRPTREHEHPYAEAEQRRFDCLTCRRRFEYQQKTGRIPVDSMKG